ncbi:hypothetical protein TrCOL_g12295 [Triparma columacea]|uniref:Uncharacterized protein n=1 Tax=Triparma columacea TaxID=722753 RepID=A0A9W7G139_9STRA|nr:hypothetical protein TrCOL_g12295 [Triparma columacea]
MGRSKSSKRSGAAHSATPGRAEPRKEQKISYGKTDEEVVKIAKDNAAIAAAIASKQKSERVTAKTQKKRARAVLKKSEKKSEMLGGSLMGLGGSGGSGKANTKKRGPKCAGTMQP